MNDIICDTSDATEALADAAADEFAEAVVKKLDLAFLAAHPPAAKLDVAAVLMEHADTAADRLRDWVIWHIARGELRGVSQSSIEALLRVAGSVDDLTFAMRQSADGAALTGHAEAILEAVDEATDAAEKGRGGYETHSQDQLVELESGRIRPIARVIVSILDFREMLIAGIVGETEALVHSAHWMIHETPAPQVTK